MRPGGERSAGHPFRLRPKESGRSNSIGGTGVGTWPFHTGFPFSYSPSNPHGISSHGVEGADSQKTVTLGALRVDTIFTALKVKRVLSAEWFSHQVDW